MQTGTHSDSCHWHRVYKRLPVRLSLSERFVDDGVSDDVYFLRWICLVSDEQQTNTHEIFWNSENIGKSTGNLFDWRHRAVTDDDAELWCGVVWCGVGAVQASSCDDPAGVPH